MHKKSGTFGTIFLPKAFKIGYYVSRLKNTDTVKFFTGRKYWKGATMNFSQARPRPIEGHLRENILFL